MTPRQLLISYKGSSFAISADISPALFMLEVFFYFKFCFSFKELTCFFDIIDEKCCHIRSEILSYDNAHYLDIFRIFWQTVSGNDPAFFLSLYESCCKEYTVSFFCIKAIIGSFSHLFSISNRSNLLSLSARVRDTSRIFVIISV